MNCKCWQIVEDRRWLTANETRIISPHALPFCRTWLTHYSSKNCHCCKSSSLRERLICSSLLSLKTQTLQCVKSDKKRIHSILQKDFYLRWNAAGVIPIGDLRAKKIIFIIMCIVRRYHPNQLKCLWQYHQCTLNKTFTIHTLPSLNSTVSSFDLRKPMNKIEVTVTLQKQVVSSERIGRIGSVCTQNMTRSIIP
jgi:hypothetical protein